MTNADYPFTKEEFDAIYSKVPRLSVEIIIQNERNEIYLTKRDIEPCKDQWHLPGGTVFFGEPMVDAVKRVGLRELGITVHKLVSTGKYIEYPSHYQAGLDSPVGIVFEVTEYTGMPRVNGEASGGDWFSKLPSPMHAEQDVFLLENGYLAKAVQ